MMGKVLKLPDKTKSVDYESEMERKLRGADFVPIAPGCKTKIGCVVDYEKFHSYLLGIKRT